MIKLDNLNVNFYELNNFLNDPQFLSPYGLVDFTKPILFLSQEGWIANVILNTIEYLHPIVEYNRERILELERSPDTRIITLPPDMTFLKLLKKITHLKLNLNEQLRVIEDTITFPVYYYPFDKGIKKILYTFISVNNDKLTERKEYTIMYESHGMKYTFNKTIHSNLSLISQMQFDMTKEMLDKYALSFVDEFMLHLYKNHPYNIISCRVEVRDN